MKRIIFNILSIFVITTLQAQNLEISVELPEAANKKVTLAFYYNSQVLIADTLWLDDKGKGVFQKDTLMSQGLYKIFLNSKKHFDFLLGEDQTFSITNEDFTAHNMKIKGGTETEEFSKYIKFLADLQKERKALSNQKKEATEEEKKEINKQLNDLTESLHNYWKNADKKYPGTFLAKFLMANYVPTPNEENIPEEVLNNDSMLLRYRFDFQKEHYFDYFDLKDERLFFTPLVKPKIETYYSKVILQTFDSLYPACLELIETVKPNEKMFQYVTSYILNKSINSKIMGMDALFVEVAKRYYLSGEAFWANEKTLDAIRENVMFMEKNLIGKTAPELLLEGVNPEEHFSLHQVEAEYTILVIYEPNCDHCKIFVPELHKQVYQKYRDKGFEVFAVYSMDDKKEWVEFLEKHDMYDWINVWDEHHLSRFKITYDARKTPGIYLLDKDKKIIAKRLSIEQIDKRLNEYLN